MVTNSFLFVEPRIRSQPEHVIVGKTSTTKRPSKNGFLSGRGVKSKAICAFNVHIHTILCYDVIVKSKERTMRFLCQLKQTASSHKTHDRCMWKRRTRNIAQHANVSWQNLDRSYKGGEMNIHVRFILGLLSVAGIIYLSFRPIPQPLNTIVLFALGFNIGYQIMSLFREGCK